MAQANLLIFTVTSEMEHWYERLCFLILSKDLELALKAS